MEFIFNIKGLVMNKKEEGIVQCQCSPVMDKWGNKRKMEVRRKSRSIKMFCRNLNFENKVLFSFLTWTFILGVLVGLGHCLETGRK